MTEIICPACGSKKLKRVEEDSTGKLTLGDTFNFKEVYFECVLCDEQYDILRETDENFLKAQKKAQSQLVKDIIRELNDEKISMSFLERVFELPVRTLTRWKKGDFSATAIAFLRIIKTYPWIVEVAEHKFDQGFSQKALVRAGSFFPMKKANEAPSSLDYVENSTRASAPTMSIQNSEEKRI